MIHWGSFLWVVKAYGFLYFLAILTVIVGTYWLARKFGFEKNKIIIFLLSVSIAGFVGARTLHFLTNWNAYVSGKYNIFSLDMKGFAISGGIAGAIFVGWLVAKKLKLDFWKLGDVSVVFLGVGIALARVGCFLNGCCFGKKTTLLWGVHFPELSQAHQYQLSHGIGSFFGVSAVHPTQIYEALAALIGSFLAIFFIRKKYPVGVAALSFLLFFSFFRLINMQLRVIPSTFDASDYFYPFLYLGVVLTCAMFLYKKFQLRRM